MTEIEYFQRLSVALAIGLLIGVERGWRMREEAEGERALGLRTLALGGLLGGVSAALAVGQGPGGLALVGAVFAVYSVVVAWYRQRELMHEGFYGATTIVAAMLVFLLGAYAVLGEMRVASACAVATAGLLAVKEVLHGWLRRMTWQELRSALVLLAMTFILLPVLPHEPIDPIGAFNPGEIWLLTIMIAAISYVGYVAIKAAGETYGVVIAGLAGGLTSSTAVTVTMSKLAAQFPEQAGRLGAGAMLAGSVMVVRVAVLIGLVNPGLLKLAAPPLAGAALAQAGLAALLLWREGASDGQASRLELRNPFEFKTVAAFAVLLTVISAVTKLASLYIGASGVLAVAAVSGLADVDAITLSMARGQEVAASVAVIAILIAVGVNTVAKAVMAWGIGGAGIGWRLMGAALLACVAGVGGYLLAGPLAALV